MINTSDPVLSLPIPAPTSLNDVAWTRVKTPSKEVVQQKRWQRYRVDQWEAEII